MCVCVRVGNASWADQDFEVRVHNKVMGLPMSCLPSGMENIVNAALLV